MAPRRRSAEGYASSATRARPSLIVRDGRCVGARFESARGTEQIEAAAVLLATGGAGQVFRETTNPAVATGDGVTLAWHAGAQVADLEFVQFHPTALNVPGAPRFLLSEALRGEGALSRQRRRRTLHDPLPAGRRAGLARPGVARDRARATPHRAAGVPLAAAPRRRLGAANASRPSPRPASRPASTWRPIAFPSGPRRTTSWAGSRPICGAARRCPGLFAAGEVACTGVHGANRLASNSLLEGLVFGARAAQAMTTSAEYRRHVQRPHRARPAEENQDVVAEKRRRSPDPDVAIGGADAGRRRAGRCGIAARILVSRARSRTSRRAAWTKPAGAWRAS